MDSRAIEEIVADVLGKIEKTDRPVAPAAKPSPAPAPKSSPAPKAAPTPKAPTPRPASGGARSGVFAEADAAIEAARGGFEQLRAKGFAGRGKVIEIVKSMCAAKAEEWGRIELEETGIGRDAVGDAVPMTGDDLLKGRLWAVRARRV